MRVRASLIAVLLSLGSSALAGPGLTYSGVLLGPNAQPLSGSQTFTFELWLDEASTAASARRCQYTEARPVDSAGRFTLPLSAECVAALQKTPELWSQLTVAQLGALPRAKVSSVPHAITASRTVLTSDAGISSTIDGLFCGSTPSTTGNFAAQQPGNLIGYRSAKAQCEQACGSRTAHMCKSSEAITSLELGLTIPDGWVKAAAASYHLYPGNASAYTNDCNGWTIGANAQYTQIGLSYHNPVPSFPAPFLDASECSRSQPILCCE